MTRVRDKKDDDVPHVVLLYCQHCVSAGTAARLTPGRCGDLTVKPVMLPCSGKLQVPHLLRLIEQGADAVQIIACPASTCRFLAGSARASRRVAYARGLLEQAHMGAERLGLVTARDLEADDVLALAAKRAEAARPLGTNRMRA